MKRGDNMRFINKRNIKPIIIVLIIIISLMCYFPPSWYYRLFFEINQKEFEIVRDYICSEEGNGKDFVSGFILSNPTGNEQVDKAVRKIIYFGRYSTIWGAASEDGVRHVTFRTTSIVESINTPISIVYNDEPCYEQLYDVEYAGGYIVERRHTYEMLAENWYYSYISK